MIGQVSIALVRAGRLWEGFHILPLVTVVSSSPENSISPRYELLILQQQPACLALIPDFMETHNYTEGDLTGP